MQERAVGYTVGNATCALYDIGWESPAGIPFIYFIFRFFIFYFLSLLIILKGAFILPPTIWQNSFLSFLVMRYRIYLYIKKKKMIRMMKLNIQRYLQQPNQVIDSLSVREWKQPRYINIFFKTIIICILSNKKSQHALLIIFLIFLKMKDF